MEIENEYHPHLSATTLDARKFGFLWVCMVGSTFFKPLVTAVPLLSSARNPPGPPGAGAEVDADGAGPGGGGGGADLAVSDDGA